jgi:hypothetical protein
MNDDDVCIANGYLNFTNCPLCFLLIAVVRGGSGELLLADARHTCFCVFSPDGHLVSTLDSFGSSSMDLPVGVAVMNDRLFAVLDKN